MRRLASAALALTLLSCGAATIHGETLKTPTSTTPPQSPATTANPVTSPFSNPNSGPPSAYACPQDANDSYAAARQACVAQINTFRATLHLKPLARWCDVGSCIDGQASQDAAANRSHSAFGQCQESAQDECPGWPLPAEGSTQSCLQQMWNEGPGTDYAEHGHYLNMSNPNYTMVECGFTANGSSFWGAQDFH